MLRSFAQALSLVFALGAATAATATPADRCGQATANTTVCVAWDNHYVAISNAAGTRLLPAVAYDSTYWAGGTDLIATGDLSNVAGFGYTSIKVTISDDGAYGHLGFLGGSVLGTQWYEWPGTTSASYFELRYPLVPCCKS